MVSTADKLEDVMVAGGVDRLDDELVWLEMGGAGRTVSRRRRDTDIEMTTARSPPSYSPGGASSGGGHGDDDVVEASAGDVDRVDAEDLVADTQQSVQFGDAAGRQARDEHAVPPIASVAFVTTWTRTETRTCNKTRMPAIATSPSPSGVTKERP